MEAGQGLERRELFRRGAVAGGAFASLWALPKLVKDAYGDPIPIPPEARSVEAGLTAVVARMLGVLQGVAERGGFPTSAGEPETFDDPTGDLEATLDPVATAPPVSRKLAEFFAGLSYDDLPPGCVEQAKEQLKSIIGAMYAGSRMPPGRKFARAVRGFGDRAECTVLGRQPFRTSVRHAALLNSVYAQVLEWEDWTFIAHSGASIVPTALAAAELVGASGKELIAAIVAGNEVLARSGDVLTDVI